MPYNISPNRTGGIFHGTGAASRAAQRLVALTQCAAPSNIHVMAHSFLIFEFGGNEETAQQARHKIDAWKQGYRLDKKLQVKFERSEVESGAEKEAAKPAKGAKKAKAQSKSAAKKSSAAEPLDMETTAVAEGNSAIRLIVRLDFSDHEKLSHSRWLERIPAEEPFNKANPRVIRAKDADFRATSDLFDSLD